MGALIKTVHSVRVFMCVRVCPSDEAFLMALGKPLACVNVGMAAIFMFMCICMCVCVGGTSVCLCVSNKAALAWMTSSVVTLIMQGRNQSTSRGAEERRKL